jgi:hypothetical protein
MRTSCRIAPPHSLVLISDPTSAEVPATMAGAAIAATSRCIAVGCRAEMDGQTELILGAMSEVTPATAPAWEGRLQTPSRLVAIRSVLGEIVLETQVSGREAQIRVWTNHAQEPDLIVVGVQ